MANFRFEITNLPNLKPLSKKIENAVIEGLDELADDLQLIAQRSAPVDSGTLERSVERGSVNKGNLSVEVSACAMNRGFNYARKMDQGQYNLGVDSAQKDASENIRSKYTTVKYKVGSGYLSKSAQQSKRGYTKHIRQKVGEVTRKF